VAAEARSPRSGRSDVVSSASSVASQPTPKPTRPKRRRLAGSRGARPLDSRELSELLDDVERTLREIGFRPRPNEVRFRGSLRDFLARARPTRGDRLMLRYVLAQVGKWKRRLAGSLRRRDGE